MQCPACHKKYHVEIDMHSDGFAENLQECGDCGALWTRKADVETLIFRPDLSPDTPLFPQPHLR